MAILRASLLCLVLSTVVFGTQTACTLFKSKESKTLADTPKPDFLERIATQAEYDSLVFADRASGLTYVKYARETKNPAATTWFQNTSRFQFHLNFLEGRVPALKGVTGSQWETLIGMTPGAPAAAKEYSAGAIYHVPGLKLPGAATEGAVVFDVYSNGKHSFAEVGALAAELRSRITFTPNVAFLITSPASITPEFRKEAAAAKLILVPLAAILSKIDKAFNYVEGTGYGYMHRLSAEELARGEYTSKDILVLDEVPLDLSPSAGVITAQPQVPHSHVVLRSANLKIPDMYVPNALSVAEFTAAEGKLVELSTTGQSGFSLKRESDFAPGELMAKAEAWWKSRRPSLPDPRSDLSRKTLIDFDPGLDWKNLAAQAGAKGTNFALLDLTLRAKGYAREFSKGAFLIPFSFFDEHLSQPLKKKSCEQGIEKCVATGSSHCAPLRTTCETRAAAGVTLRAFLRELTAADRAQALVADAPLRKATLSFARGLIAENPLPDRVEAEVRAHIKASWGETTRVRLRSSSNAEDLPGLTGAGLYTSKAACLADDNVPKGGGSACMTPLEKDRIQKKIAALKLSGSSIAVARIAALEKKLVGRDTLKDALRGAYSSIWNDQAFLSRDFYGIDSEKIYMGLLAHASFEDESADGVVIADGTLDPASLKLDIVIQPGDESITNPDSPGETADSFSVTYGIADGSLSPLAWATHSSLSGGKDVLTAAEIADLGKQIAIMREALVGQFGVSMNKLDIEFKRDARGNILPRQARPYF